jgi:hypothetical protein
MSQQTFNRTILIGFLLLIVTYLFGKFSGDQVVFMSTEIPKWVGAVIVFASGMGMFGLQNLARKEARQKAER